MATRTTPRRTVLALALVLAIVAAGPAAAAPAPVEIRVMTFNLWLGGDVVDFGKVIETIESARADVVGLQEAEGNTRRVAAALGWPYWSDRLHVVSRFPLIDPPAAKGEYVLAQVRPGEVFALANVHLTSDPYGPYAVREGRSLARVLALERRTRLPEIRATLAAVAPLQRRRTHADDRCLQHPVAPRLDRRGGRRPARRALSRRVAGDQRARERRLPGRLACHTPGPRGGARDHLDVRVPVPAARGRSGRTRPPTTRRGPGTAFAGSPSTTFKARSSAMGGPYAQEPRTRSAPPPADQYREGLEPAAPARDTIAR